MTWRMVPQVVFPRSRMRSSDLSFVVFLSSSSGIRLRGPLRSDSSALGSRSSMFPFSGLCWWFTGWSYSRWRVRMNNSGRLQSLERSRSGNRRISANKACSAETNPTHDQIPIRALLIWQGEVHQEQLLIKFRADEERNWRQPRRKCEMYRLWWRDRTSIVQKYCWTGGIAWWERNFKPFNKWFFGAIT